MSKSRSTILQEFKDWVGRQPPERAYNYNSVTECPAGLFSQSLGYPKAPAKSDAALSIFRATHDFDGWKILSDYPNKNWTFGALHERLKNHHPTFKEQ